MKNTFAIINSLAMLFLLHASILSQEVITNKTVNEVPEFDGIYMQSTDGVFHEMHVVKNQRMSFSTQGSFVDGFVIKDSKFTMRSDLTYKFADVKGFVVKSNVDKDKIHFTCRQDKVIDGDEDEIVQFLYGGTYKPKGQWIASVLCGTVRIKKKKIDDMTFFYKIDGNLSAGKYCLVIDDDLYPFDILPADPK